MYVGLNSIKTNVSNGAKIVHQMRTCTSWRNPVGLAPNNRLALTWRVSRSITPWSKIWQLHTILTHYCSYLWAIILIHHSSSDCARVCLVTKVLAHAIHWMLLQRSPTRNTTIYSTSIFTIHPTIPSHAALLRLISKSLCKDWPVGTRGGHTYRTAQSETDSKLGAWHGTSLFTSTSRSYWDIHQPALAQTQSDCSNGGHRQDWGWKESKD